MIIHLRIGIAPGLKRPTRGPGRATLYALLFGLAPDGVYQPIPVTRDIGGLLPRHFTLTRPGPGGIFSVALSFWLPRLGVTQHPALWSSDFPPVRPKA